MTDTPKPRKLTIKQKKFVKEYVATGEKTEAYKRAYDVNTENKASIQRMAVETSSIPHVKQAIDEALIRQGITIDVAVAPIAEALNHEQLDYRLKGSDRALKLMGADKNTDNPLNANFIQVNNNYGERYQD